MAMTKAISDTQQILDNTVNITLLMGKRFVRWHSNPYDSLIQFELFRNEGFVRTKMAGHQLALACFGCERKYCHSGW